MESQKGDVLEEVLLGKEDGEARNRVGIDEMLQKWVGEFGHWQLRHFVLTSLAWALEALLTMVMIFADRQPDWRCTAHATSCNPRGSVCSMESGSWEWIGGRAVSTVSEWGLICGDKIGRQVSRLKGHSSKQIRSMAELFLRSWENLVDEWMKTAGDVATAGTSSDSVSGEGIDKENGLPAPPLDEGAFFSAQTTSIEMSQDSRKFVLQFFKGSTFYYCIFLKFMGESDLV